MVNKYIRAFVAGSAFPVMVSVIVFYFLSRLILGFGEEGFTAIDFLTVPILVGLVNMLHVYALEKWPTKKINLRLILVGLIAGFVFALIGIYSNVPEELFGITGSLSYISLGLAPIGYAVIWRFVIKYLNIIVGLK